MPVGTDLGGELGGHRGTVNDHLDVAEVSGPDRTDDVLHADHGRGEERADADDLGVVFPRGVDEAFGGTSVPRSGPERSRSRRSSPA